MIDREKIIRDYAKACKWNCLAILFFIHVTCTGQQSRIISDSLYSKAIANTITKQDPIRKIAIYLPAGYTTSTHKYPVLYLLHGVGDEPETFTGDTLKYHNIKDLMDAGILDKKFGEMIIVMPNEKTNWFGSFYTNSSTTGNWENFTVNELVNYIDSKYKTLATVSSRAIAGHSMGGYGAFTLAMKHPEVYSVTYAVNAAFFCFCGELTAKNPYVAKFVKAKTIEELLPTTNYVAVGLLNLARAFSPNPLNPPLYLDKPFLLKDNTVIPNPDIYKKWMEKDPVVMADTYKANLLKLKAIKFDSGNADDSKFIIENNRKLSEKLEKLKIPHRFEEYNGGHEDKLWGLEGRFYNDVLPFVYTNVEKL